MDGIDGPNLLLDSADNAMNARKVFLMLVFESPREVIIMLCTRLQVETNIELRRKQSNLADVSMVVCIIPSQRKKEKNDINFPSGLPQNSIQQNPFVSAFSLFIRLMRVFIHNFNNHTS